MKLKWKEHALKTRQLAIQKITGQKNQEAL